MKTSHKRMQFDDQKFLNYWIIIFGWSVWTGPSSSVFWNSLVMGCSRRSTDAEEDCSMPQGHSVRTLCLQSSFCSLLAPWVVQLKPTWDVHGQERHELEHIVWTSSWVPIHADLCRSGRTTCTWLDVEIRASAASLPSELTHSDGQVTEGRAEPPHSIQTGVAWTCMLAVQPTHCCSSPSDYGLRRERGHEQHQRPVFGAQFVAVWGGRNRCPPTCPRVRPWLEPRRWSRPSCGLAMMA